MSERPDIPPQNRPALLTQSSVLNDLLARIGRLEAEVDFLLTKVERLDEKMQKFAMGVDNLQNKSQSQQPQKGIPGLLRSAFANISVTELLAILYFTGVLFGVWYLIWIGSG